MPASSGRDGSPMFKPRYTVLAEDRVRWVGDCVAFVVADTPAQAMDAAELIKVDYEELPDGRFNRRGGQARRRARLRRLPRQYFVHGADRRQGRHAMQASPKPRMWSKHRFVINRVTAVTMEPRGAVARFTRGDNRYTIYGATQRPHGFRAELAQILRVHETAVHVITGDTGGSFGMKTPVFNEIPLVCYAAKLTGRPVKWISTRTEAFLSDAQGRDNVTEAELALDKAGHFLALRVKTTAAIGAYLQNNMPAIFPQCRHARRHLSHAGDLCRGNRRLHQHQSGAPLSRQWPAGGRLHHRAHGGTGRARTEHRQRRAAPAQLHQARRKCRSRPA